MKLTKHYNNEQLTHLGLNSLRYCGVLVAHGWPHTRKSNECCEVANKTSAAVYFRIARRKVLIRVRDQCSAL